MKALVTGGAGFIGSHLVRALLEDGCKVVVLDDLSSGTRENLAEVEGKVKLLEASVTDLEVCRQACQGVKLVFHQAAIPSVEKSVSDPLASHAANATGTLNMLLAAKEAGASRFVAAASCSAYGDQEGLPHVETMAPSPMSPYAAQKLLLEIYCEQFHKLHGLETFALRYFNIFGPRQDPLSPYGAVIPKFISALLGDEAPIIHGDGEQSRDFTYVENVVRANLLAAWAPAKAAGRVCNIGCGERYSVSRLLEILERITGVHRTPLREPARAGDVKHSLGDISRARELLGYDVTVGFEEGLERTVAYYRAQLGQK
jgi:nucleoside-diphosphate-sugar epimerase